MASSKPDDSTLFIKAVMEIMGWRDLRSEFVMDMGCGNGRTAKAILRAFPDVRKVIAVDVDIRALAAAEAENPSRKIVYEQADVRSRLAISRWAGGMDKVVSAFCFNCFSELHLAYGNMFCVLKPGGEAAFVQSLRSGYYNFIEEMKNHPRWHKYIGHVKLPTSKEEAHTLDHYKKLLEDIGFEVLHIFEETKIYGHTFASDDECKNMICNSCPLFNYIPERERPEFFEMSFEVFQKHNKRDSNGLIYLEHCALTACLRKPKIVHPPGLKIPIPERLV